MQPTLYNNSLWVRTEQRHSVIYHFKVLTLPAWNAEALSQRGCCPCCTQSWSHLPLVPAKGPSLLISLLGAAGSPDCCRRHRDGEWGLQVVFSSSCCLPSKPRDAISFALRFLLIPSLLHLAVLVREWNDLSEGPELICQPGIPSCIPWVQRILCCCRRSEIAPLNSKLMQESGKMSWSW